MLTGTLSVPDQAGSAEWKRQVHAAAGTGHGTPSRVQAARRTAYDDFEAHLLLRAAFSDDEMRRIPIVAPGARLEEEAAYVDLRDPSREPIRAAAAMTAGEAQLLVPRAEVDSSTWERLTREVPPGQTGG
jgi:hypothetical protein